MNSVSILIPTRNRRHLLERCVNSLLNQVEKADEIIIVNDGSTDDTEQYLTSLSNLTQIRVVHRKSAGGVNRARHEGIKNSTKDWVAILDDDDEFFPDAVKNIKKKLAETPPSTLIVFFNSVIRDNNGDRNGGFMFKDEAYYDLNYFEMMVKHRINGDCKPVFNKEVFEKGYRFPETVNGLESYLFYLVARDGIGIRCYPDKTTLIHQETAVGDRLSISASVKNPWPLLVVHFKQLFQHFRFNITHPVYLMKKLLEMSKLFVRSLVQLVK